MYFDNSQITVVSVVLVFVGIVAVRTAVVAIELTLSRSTFRANLDDGADFGQDTAAQILAELSAIAY